MLFLYRTALNNEHTKEEDRQPRSSIYFTDNKTNERFSATLLSITMGDPIDEFAGNGNQLLSSSSEWLIELDNGDSYTRRAEHRILTDIFYPHGWDHGETISSPISIYVMSCAKGGSLRVGISCDDWVSVERGDMKEYKAG